MRSAMISKEPHMERCAPIRSVADSAGATTTNVPTTNAAASAKPTNLFIPFLLEVDEDFLGRPKEL